jgi:hypothetical protein
VNWLVKVDYANGSDAGWPHLETRVSGDFAIVAGTDPTDWFYAEHGPSFASTNTTGKVLLILFDNGDVSRTRFQQYSPLVGFAERRACELYPESRGHSSKLIMTVVHCRRMPYLLRILAKRAAIVGQAK